MKYGELFEKAWKIIWKFKVLWIFGLLASCSSDLVRGSGGSQGGGSSSSNGSLINGTMHQAGNWAQGLWGGVLHPFLNEPNWPLIVILIAVAIVLTLTIVLLSFVLGIIGRAGLVRGSWKADEGVQKLPFGKLFKESLKYFWRLFGFTILYWVGTMALGVVLVPLILLVTIFTLGLGLALVIPLTFLLVWFLVVYAATTKVAIVGENLGVFKAMERAWQVIWANLGVMVLVSLILLAGSLVVSFIIGLPILVVILPAIVGVLTESQAGMTTGLIVSGVFFLIYLPMALLISAGMHAYLGTTWTLMFRRLTGQAGVPLGSAEPEEEEALEISKPITTETPALPAEPSKPVNPFQTLKVAPPDIKNSEKPKAKPTKVLGSDKGSSGNLPKPN